MKAAYAVILYFIVLLYNFHGILGEALLMDFFDSQLSGPTPCNFSTDCHHLKNAVCINDYCDCGGSKFCVSNLEQRLLKLGESCESSSDCLIENSACQERKCRCKEGTAATIDGRKCIKGQESILNADNRCNSEGCQCKAGYVSNFASTECLKIAQELNSPCAEDVQCLSKIENSVCHEGHCRCNESYTYVAIDNMCFKDLSFSIGSLNATDSRTPRGCVDGLCEEPKVQLSLKADNPCIGGLCDGFRKEQKIGCTVGRCECPEERKFCTNRAEFSSNKRQSSMPDSGRSSAGFLQIGHISDTLSFKRLQYYISTLVKDHVPFAGSFAGTVTVTIFWFSLQTICAFSEWRGMFAFLTLIFFLNFWLMQLAYQLDLDQLVETYWYFGAYLGVGFLLFVAFLTILERHPRISRTLNEAPIFRLN